MHEPPKLDEVLYSRLLGRTLPRLARVPPPEDAAAAGSGARLGRQSVPPPAAARSDTVELDAILGFDPLPPRGPGPRLAWPRPPRGSTPWELRLGLVGKALLLLLAAAVIGLWLALVLPSLTRAAARPPAGATTVAAAAASPSLEPLALAPQR